MFVYVVLLVFRPHPHQQDDTSTCSTSIGISLTASLITGMDSSTIGSKTTPITSATISTSMYNIYIHIIVVDRVSQGFCPERRIMTKIWSSTLFCFHVFYKSMLKYHLMTYFLCPSFLKEKTVVWLRSYSYNTNNLPVFHVEYSNLYLNIEQ